MWTIIIDKVAYYPKQAVYSTFCLLQARYSDKKVTLQFIPKTA